MIGSCVSPTTRKPPDPMNETELSLWQKIEAFPLDEPGAGFPFSRKLARENGWESGYAARAIREYRRFLYLYCQAGHPVSPSDTIDQVWHLHLTYTQSYWNRLCQDTLGRPLHHVPGQGRPGEDAKFTDWYARTLASYTAHFGESPPADIWPPAHAAGGGRKPRHRRIDLARHWVIPRPRNLFWLIGASACAAILLSLGGCHAIHLAPDNILNLKGPAFLAFYLKFAAACLLAAVILRFLLRAPGGSPPLIADDPYLYAWLAGGDRRTAHAALAHLADLGLVQTGGERIQATPRPEPAGLHPLEKGLLDRLRRGSLGMDGWIRETALCGAPLAEELESKGLVLTPRARNRARWRPLLIALVPVLLGTAKIGVGLDRGKPVSFLVILTLATLVAACLATGRRAWQSRRGARLLSKLRGAHAGIKDLRHASRTGAIDPMQMSVALFGPAVLYTSTFSHLAPLMGSPPPATGGGDAGGSGCGSSCGGGDGGGGCGGCGGGD